MLEQCSGCPRWGWKVVRTVFWLMALSHDSVRSILHSLSYLAPRRM
jgi:hypothetical protein